MSPLTDKLLAAVDVSNYQLLEPQLLRNGAELSSFTGYIQTIFKMTITIGAVFAVLMIVIGGVEKIISKTPAGQGDGSEKIKSSIIGLILLITSASLLYTINPTLLNLDFFNPGPATSNPGDPGTPGDPSTPDDNNNPPDNGPITPGGAKEATKEDPTGSGTGTEFGYQDAIDNGRGTPLLDPAHGSGIGTNNTTVQGVALPEEVLTRTLGIPNGSRSWSAWQPARDAAVRVRNANGEEMIVPIVDLGPGRGPRERGVVIDQTHAVNQRLGGDGHRDYEIIPDYYKTHPRP